jgi:hypothetical protein
MEKLSWADFVRLHPAAHLVTAAVVPPRSGHHLARLPRQLIRKQAPASDYATAIVRISGFAEIHCGFAAKADADRLASLVKARVPRRPPEAVVSGWLSHRTFVLNATKEVALAGLLATPRDSRRTS